MRAHATMLRFRIGQRVSFRPEGRGSVAGVVTRYDKRSVSVLTDAGQRWTVAPGLLTAEPENTKQGAGAKAPRDNVLAPDREA